MAFQRWFHIRGLKPNSCPRRVTANSGLATRRIRKLESQLTDATGLVPHSKKSFDYWYGKIDRVIAGEKNVDLCGMTLEVTDAIIANGTGGTAHDTVDLQTASQA